MTKIQVEKFVELVKEKKKMNKKDFKKRVLDWLAENKIFPKRVRVFDSPRYGLEVRIYQEPMEYQNTRKSFRETSRDENQRQGVYGIHSRKISLYTHINEIDFKSEPEKTFILETLKTSNA